MTPTEQKVASICGKILGVQGLRPEDDLYDLGSDSQQAVLIALDIERAFDVSLPLEIMESSGVIREIAAWVDRQLSTKDAAG